MMITNNIYLKNETKVSIQIESNLIKTRTMFNNVLKTSNRMINQNLQKVTDNRTFASIAGKYKQKEFVENNAFIKKVYNNHAQYITDFNLIYEDPKDIRLYSIASLHTQPVKESHTISTNQNYKFEAKPQEIQFHKSPTWVKNDLHIVKDSQQYFDNPDIKKNVEKFAEYKYLYDQVIKELNEKSIKYRVAQSPEDHTQTGFNVFVNTYKLSSTNKLLDKLTLPSNDDKE